MPTATKTKPVDTNNYAELLKDATKTITVDLPSQSGTLDQIREKNEIALKAAGWTGQDYTITPATQRYSYYSYGNSHVPAKAKFERLLTAEEIATDGPKLYKAKLAAEKKAATARAKNIAKLRELQTKLGLPLYEGV